MVGFLKSKLLLGIGAGVAVCATPSKSISQDIQHNVGHRSAAVLTRDMAEKNRLSPDSGSEPEKGISAAQSLVEAASPSGRVSRKAADSITDALRHAYLNNPQLRAQRANTRSVDENLQIAFGSFMPKISGQASAGILSFNLLNSRYDASAFGGRDGFDLKSNTNPVFGAITGTINIFNGFKGVNGINQAEAQIHQSRELLRASEMSVFLATVQSYMAILNDAATFRIRKNYAAVVSQQLAVAREKVAAGEISSTDLKEIETYLAQAEKNSIAANTALQGSIAYYKRVTGQSPTVIGPAASISEKLPKSLEMALQTGFAEHPLVVAARYNVDINKYAIKIAESGLLPTVDLVTSYGQNWNYFGTQGQRLYQGGGGIVVNVPFYDGGVSYSSTRQAKERLAESEALFDLQISQIRQQLSLIHI